MSVKKYIAEIIAKKLKSEPKQHLFHTHLISSLPILCCTLLSVFSHVFFLYYFTPASEMHFIWYLWDSHEKSISWCLKKIFNKTFNSNELWHHLDVALTSEAAHPLPHCVSRNVSGQYITKSSLPNRTVLEEDPIDCKVLQGWPGNGKEHSLSSHGRHYEHLVNWVVKWPYGAGIPTDAFLLFSE